MEEDVFQCTVQLCGIPSLDLVQEGQLIGTQEWTHWDAERPKELSVGGTLAFTSSDSGTDTESTAGNIDCDSDYDLESLMDTDVVSDVDSFDWEKYPLPENVQELRSQMLTPRGMSTSPVSSPSVHVHDYYRPVTPIYSPYLP